MGTIGPCEYGVTGRCQYMYTYICVVCIGLRLLLSRDTRLIFFSRFSHPVREVPPMKLKNDQKSTQKTPYENRLFSQVFSFFFEQNH